MLLHMIGRRARSISPSTISPIRNHVINEVQHGTIVIAVGHIEDGTATEVAEIGQLLSRRGIERRAIEHHEVAPIAHTGLNDRCRETQKRAVVVIETFCHFVTLVGAHELMPNVGKVILLRCFIHRHDERVPEYRLPQIPSPSTTVAVAAWASVR